MAVPEPQSLVGVFAGLTFLPDRTPEASDETGWAAMVAEYRDGGVFAAHYAGNSEWERHSNGDEVVMVIEGNTTVFLLIDGDEHAHAMGPNELIVVPEGTWHRFESPDGVKILTVTPQPTDHSAEMPRPS